MNPLKAMAEGLDVRWATRVVQLSRSPTGWNVATEDVLYMLQGLGIETGIDLDKVAATGEWICAILKREPGSKAGRAIAAKRAA